jgi:hypothetical protein
MRFLRITVDDVRRLTGSWITVVMGVVVLASPICAEASGWPVDASPRPVPLSARHDGTARDRSDVAPQANPQTVRAAGQRGRGANPNANEPNDANDTNAMTLLRQVVDAKGGLAALKGVRTVVADAQTRVLTPQNPIASTTRSYVSYPDRFRIDVTIPDPSGAGQAIELVQTYNAGKGWIKDPAGVHEPPPEMLSDFAASVRRDMFPLLINAVEGRLTVRRLPDEGTGADARQVLEIRGRDLGPVRLYINSDRLIAKQSYSVPGPDGRPVPTEEVFSDYRTVDGIRVPFDTQLARAGSPTLRRTFTKVTFNAPIAPGFFDQPR